MANLFITQAGALALQSAGLAGWTNPKADLCTALPVAPDRLAVIADFTIPTYTGYAQATATLTGGFVEGVGGKVYADTPLMSWTGPAAAGGPTVIGFVIADSMAHTVWAWGQFNGPLSLADATQLVLVLLRLFEDESFTVTVLS